MVFSLFARAVCGLGLIGAALNASAADCTSITGGNTTASAIGDCALCTTLNPNRAIDGNQSTAASVVVPVNTDGRNGLRATAQRGIVFSAGSRPGALLKVTKSTSVAVNTQGILRTYLNGRQQDQATFVSGGIVDVNGVGTLTGLANLKASKPFNAVEVVFDGSYSGYNIEVFELCSDSKK